MSDRNLLECSLHCSWLSSWSPHTFLHTLDLMENHSAQTNSKGILRLCFLSVFLMGVWWRSSIPWRHHTVLHRKKSNLLIQFNTVATSATATAVSTGNSYVNIVSITEVYSLVVRSELNLHWNWFHHTWSWCTTIVQPINWTSLNWVGASTSNSFVKSCEYIMKPTVKLQSYYLHACVFSCFILLIVPHQVLFQQLRFFCHNWIDIRSYSWICCICIHTSAWKMPTTTLGQSCHIVVSCPQSCLLDSGDLELHLRLANFYRAWLYTSFLLIP